MANISPGLMSNMEYRPIWRYQEKRGAELCDCCLFKNRKRKNLASIEYGHGLRPLTYFSACLLPKRCQDHGGILLCPPKKGCDAWLPIWNKERQILDVVRQMTQTGKIRKMVVPENQLELWNR